MTKQQLWSLANNQAKQVSNLKTGVAQSADCVVVPDAETGIEGRLMVFQWATEASGGGLPRPPGPPLFIGARGA